MTNPQRRKVRSSVLAGLAAFSMVFTPLAASAQRIYVNGVDITGSNLRNWTLSRVEAVEFDAEGNVRIAAPAYNVQVVPPAPTASADAPVGSPAVPAPTPQDAVPRPPATPPSQGAAATTPPRGGQQTPTMAQRYVMTLSNAVRGSVPYAIDIVINGRHVATWGHDRGNSALDVTEFIVPGRNVVTFLGRRQAGAPVGVDSDQMQVLVGVGSYDGRVASVEQILAGQVFKASDTEPERRVSVDFQVAR